MEFNWETFLDDHRDFIAREWKSRLRSSVSERYAKRSSLELGATTSQACDAFSRVLAKKDFRPINQFIDQITRIRLKGGFPLADVQKAFELYRQIVIPLLIKNSSPEQFLENIEAVNGCLAYTIHRFSSHFQKEHEAYLMERKSRELERMAYIGHLTASLSHEIRNPLSSVKMNLQILGKNNLFSGNDLRRLDITQREIRRLERILQELLEFAKPVTVSPAMTDINIVIRTCMETLDVKIRKKRVTCTFQPEKRLPDIPADKGKLEQLIINLLLNALESVGRYGKIDLSTSLSEKEGRSFALIRVADDGTGIPADCMDRIFDAFYTTKASGTGLGLANVRRIVDAHNGHVAAANRETGGAAISVSLPMGE